MCCKTGELPGLTLGCGGGGLYGKNQLGNVARGLKTNLVLWILASTYPYYQCWG